MITWQIIFWATLFLILHSYVLFPGFLRIRAVNKKPNTIFFKDDELPRVSVVMAVHNEEKVLYEKLISILESDYPSGKITIYTGSDASTDGSNNILREFEKKHTAVRPIFFETRQGKPTVINRVMEIVEDEVVIMTDAKVIFQPNTIKKLVRHFANPDIGSVGGNIQSGTITKSGVSFPEKTFMEREIMMKYREGIIWGASTGLYGALYAIRKENYLPVPNGFAVDDFFITMNVLRQKKKSILDIHAIAHENVPDLMSEEYKGKFASRQEIYEMPDIS